MDPVAMRQQQRWRWRLGVLCMLVVSVACGPRQSIKAADGSSTGNTPAAAAPTVLDRPTAPLDLADAEQYVLALINRDRAGEGLPPVAWDETAAKAGTRHVRDMVTHGFTAHWGTDGSIPEQRYTESGGVHMAQENAGCFADGKERELDSDPRFDAEELERIESAFFNETPPNDGHRKNILKRWHTHVGVGLAKAKGAKIVCQAQEFVDRYGDYDDLPQTAKKGEVLRIAGEVEAPAKFIGVGLARVALPLPRTPADLMATSTYPIPAPYATYFPAGYKTPKPVTVKGSSFSIDLPLSDRGKGGLYEVSIWGEVPGTKDFVMISLRTIRVP
jgi:uncharacterized protein YkwD